MSRRVALLLLGLALLATDPTRAKATGLAITDVAAEPAAFDPIDGTTEVRFVLSAAAGVELRIYDGRDLLVRTIRSEGALPVGEASMPWDGRDEQGRPVPPEAYHYTLTASGSDGEPVTHDLTDLTAGEELTVTDVRYDPATRLVQYRLPTAARVNIRVGLDGGGPLLGTIRDWVPRAAGAQTETWDGQDASQVLDLREHPKRRFFVNAFALPRNTILVLPAPQRVAIIQELPWGREPRAAQPRKSGKQHFQAGQPIEQRRDIPLRLVLPEGLERTKDGAYRVPGPVPIRVEVDPADRARLLNQRFEAMFFLDGVFLQENELGFLPMTWHWDLLGVTPGEHYFTANVIGFDGHVGAATVKVLVGEKGKGEKR